MDGSIVGVIGTVIGTVLGWALNSYSKRGKLTMYINNWGELFEMLDEYGGFKPSMSVADTTNYKCHFNIDIYNSSSEPKIMRSLKICFFDNDKELLSIKPYDSNTRRFSGGMIHYDEIESVNLPGKSLSSLHVASSIGDDRELLDLLCQSNEVFLTYRNEKNKLIKIFVTKHCCNDLFNYDEERD